MIAGLAPRRDPRRVDRSPSGSFSRSCRRSFSTLRARQGEEASGTSFGEQLPENLDVLASPSAPVTASPARSPSSPTRRRAVEARVHAASSPTSARHPARRGARGDGEPHAERRHRPGRGARRLVQREAGGNTAEVLDQVTKNIRARMDVRRLVKVLTTQGKFSSWVVAGVPVGVRSS